jgi:hypothetical protein
MLVWLGGLHGVEAGVDAWTTNGPYGGPGLGPGHRPEDAEHAALAFLGASCPARVCLAGRHQGSLQGLNVLAATRGRRAMAPPTASERRLCARHLPSTAVWTYALFFAASGEDDAEAYGAQADPKDGLIARRRNVSAMLWESLNDEPTDLLVESPA